MSDTERASRIVEQMLEEDAFSRWLGIESLEVGEGRSVVRLQVRREMINGFGVCHGGVAFSLADSALAFASNSRGRLCVLLDASMSYPAKVVEGDWLTASTQEMSVGRTTAVYNITVLNQREQVVGVFRGTVFRTAKEWSTAEG